MYAKSAAVLHLQLQELQTLFIDAMLKNAYADGADLESIVTVKDYASQLLSYLVQQ